MGTLNNMQMEDAQKLLQNMEKVLQKDVVKPVTHQARFIPVEELFSTYASPNVEEYKANFQQIDDSIISETTSTPTQKWPKLDTEIHQKFLVLHTQKADAKLTNEIDYTNPASITQCSKDPENVLFPCSPDKDSMAWLELIEKLNQHHSENHKAILSNALKAHFQALVDNKHYWAYPYLIALDLYALLAARQVADGLLKMQTFFALELVLEQLKTGVLPLLDSLLIRFVDFSKVDERFNYRSQNRRNDEIKNIDDVVHFLTLLLSANYTYSYNASKKEIKVRDLVTNCGSLFYRLHPELSAQVIAINIVPASPCA
ncbi:MAG: hypothetical protein ACK4PR_05405 [Gammaproteobacteria bacterium]